MKKKITYIGIILLSLLIACDNKSSEKIIPITMDNPNTIVTETDSAFLSNIVEDITSKETKYSQQSADANLQKIDLNKKQDSLQNKSITDLTSNGTNIDLGNGATIALSVKATSNNSGSKIILNSNASPENIQLKVSGIEEATLAERVFTNLSVKINEQLISLEELPVSTGDWITLPNKNNLYVGTSKSAYAFKNATHEKISLATENALRKMGKTNKEIKEALKFLEKTNTANDAPCQIDFNSCDWKITGKQAGKPFEKIIHFENKN